MAKLWGPDIGACVTSRENRWLANSTVTGLALPAPSGNERVFCDGGRRLVQPHAQRCARVSGRMPPRSSVRVFPNEGSVKSDDDANNDEKKNDPVGRILLVLFLDFRVTFHS